MVMLVVLHGLGDAVSLVSYVCRLETKGLATSHRDHLAAGAVGVFTSTNFATSSAAVTVKCGGASLNISSRS